MRPVKPAVLFFLLIVTCAYVQVQSSTPDTLNGVLEEHETDNDGNVKSICLQVLDDNFNANTYIIDNNAKGSELMDLVGLNINIVAIVKANPDGTKTVTVMEYFIPEDDVFSLPDDMD